MANFKYFSSKYSAKLFLTFFVPTLNNSKKYLLMLLNITYSYLITKKNHIKTFPKTLKCNKDNLHRTA